MYAMGPTIFNPYIMNMNNPGPSTMMQSYPTVLDLCMKKNVEHSNYTTPRVPPVYNQPLTTTITPRVPPVYNQPLTTTTTPRVPPVYNPPSTATATTTSAKSLQPPNEEKSNTEEENSFPKLPRPFKAFPKNPLSFTLNVLASMDPLQTTQGPDHINYDDFRKNILAATVQESNNGINKNMRRYHIQSEKNNDPEYLEKRKKNNEAAKKSRDARKAREDEIAIRCAFLEQENLKLKAKMIAAEADVQRLKHLALRR